MLCDGSLRVVSASNTSASKEVQGETTHGQLEALGLQSVF